MVHDPTTAALALLRADPRRWTAVLCGCAGEAGDAELIAGCLSEQFGLLERDALEQAERERERWRQEGILALSRQDAGYPCALRRPDVAGPPVVFMRGSPSVFAAANDAVSIVGSRHPSSGGVRAATDAVRVSLASERLIVSGLAAGIDTAVHRETLRLGGRTLAVIGTGLHRCHPPQNRELAERIALSGALLSPFWPETPVSRATFPIRTALMAALAATTVIAEAGEHSGTRIQARRALELGHRVLLLAPVLDQPWARELAAQTGVEVVRSPGELGAALDGSLSAGAGPR